MVSKTAESLRKIIKIKIDTPEVCNRKNTDIPSANFLIRTRTGSFSACRCSALFIRIAGRSWWIIIAFYADIPSFGTNRPRFRTISGFSARRTILSI